MFSQLQIILGLMTSLMTSWDIIFCPFFTYLIFKHSTNCQRSLNLLAKQFFKFSTFTDAFQHQTSLKNFFLICFNPECMEMDNAYRILMIWGSKKVSLLLQ